MQVNYLDASEERGRESDQSSYQQSDERDTDTDSDTGQDFGKCHAPTPILPHPLSPYPMTSAWIKEKKRPSCELF